MVGVRVYVCVSLLDDWRSVLLLTHTHDAFNKCSSVSAVVVVVVVCQAQRSVLLSKTKYTIVCKAFWIIIYLFCCCRVVLLLLLRIVFVVVFLWFWRYRSFVWVSLCLLVYVYLSFHFNAYGFYLFCGFLHTFTVVYRLFHCVCACGFLFHVQNVILFELKPATTKAKRTCVKASNIFPWMKNHTIHFRWAKWKKLSLKPAHIYLTFSRSSTLPLSKIRFYIFKHIFLALCAKNIYVNFISQLNDMNKNYYTVHNICKTIAPSTFSPRSLAFHGSWQEI